MITYLQDNSMGGLMGTLCRKNRITYQPDQWSQRLGDQCKKCQKNLCYQKCVSPCKCYLFCHEQCFKKSFSKQIHDLNTEVTCIECGNEVRMNLKTQFIYDPKPTCIKLCRVSIVWLLLIIVIFLIVLTLNSQLNALYLYFIVYVEALVLSLFLYWFVVCCRDFLFRQNITITEIGSTKLDIQTSAFQELEMDTNTELGKNGLQGVTI